MPDLTAKFRCPKCRAAQQVAVAPEQVVTDKAHGSSLTAEVTCPRCGYLQKAPVQTK